MVVAGAGGMANKILAHEKVPVLASDGMTCLGFCDVTKFMRSAGEPLKEIVISDMQDRPVARLAVFIRHSRVHCETFEELTDPVASKKAALVAQAALEVLAEGPSAILHAISTMARQCYLEGMTDPGQVPP